MSLSSKLLPLISGLRHFGVGTKVTRDIYGFPDTYWIITSAKVGKNDNYMKIKGRQVWRGIAKPKDENIRSTLKKQWRIVTLPDYSKFSGETGQIENLIPTNTERTC